MNERKNDYSNLVPFAAALRRPDPARMAEFAETARRLQHERAASEDIVSRALRDTSREAEERARREAEEAGFSPDEPATPSGTRPEAAAGAGAPRERRTFDPDEES